MKRLLLFLALMPSLAQALPYFSGLYVSGTVDTSGNGRNATSSTGFTSITTYPKVFYGTIGAVGSSGANSTLPTSVIQADMKGNTLLSFGAYFGADGTMIGSSGTYCGGTVSFAGQECSWYTDWNGGPGRRLLLKAGGTFAYSNTNGVWQLDRPYGAIVNVYPTHVDLVIHDVAMHALSVVASLNVSLNVQSPTNICVGSLSGSFNFPYYLEDAFFSDTTFTTAGPFEGFDNYKNAIAVINLGDSSVQGFGCTPTANTSPGLYVGGWYWPMTALSYAGSDYFYPIGYAFNPPTDSSVPLWSPSSNEGYSGQTSDAALTDWQTDEPHINPFGGTGVNVVIINGGMHGNDVAPYSSSTVQTYTQNLVAAEHTGTYGMPKAWIGIMNDYPIQSPPVGSIQNPGYLGAYNAISSTAYGFYLNITAQAFTSNTCGNFDNYTHPLKVGFYDQEATWLYGALATVVATSTPTPTVTPILTPTPTFTVSSTPSQTPLPTATFTVSPTDTPTFTSTRTPTFTKTNTVTRTFTATPTISPTFTITPTFSTSPTRSPSPTITPTWTACPTNTPNYSPTATPSPTPTVTPTVTCFAGWTPWATPPPVTWTPFWSIPRCCNW